MQTPESSFLSQGRPMNTHRKGWRMIRGRYSARDCGERAGDYEIMLLTMDIIVIDQIQRYSKRLRLHLEEQGLYRQEAKKGVNQICKVIDRLYHLVLEADEIKFAPMWRHAFPHFVDEYLADGGGLVTKLQSAYDKRWNSEVEKLFWAERQVLSYNNAKHGELLALAYVIYRLSQIAEQVSDRVTEKLLMDQYGIILAQMKMPLKLHKQIQHCAKAIWNLFKDSEDDYNSTEYLEGSVKDVITRITTHLVGMDNLRLTTDTMAVAMQEYVDYALARIRMMQVTGTYDDSAMDHLVAVCGANLTSKLLGELSEVAVEDDADTFDVMANMLPLSDTPTALNRARKLFFDKMFIE